MAVEALLNVPEDRPPWRFLVLGDGPLRSELEEQVRRRGRGDRMQFLGFRNDVYPHMAACSCLLLPSRVEGMPLVLSEAMTMGVPVVASDIDAIRGMVRERDLLVPGNDVGAWTARLECILQKGIPSPLTPSGDFGFDTMVDRYLAVYGRVCEGISDGSGVRSRGGKGPKDTC